MKIWVIERYPTLEFYGWTYVKEMIKIFTKQRSKKKYKINKFDYDENRVEIGEEPPEDQMLDFIELPSTRGMKFKLISTGRELMEYEKRLQRYMIEKCCLSEDDNIKKSVIDAFVHLDSIYANALDFIGFKPPEVDMMYDSVNGDDYYRIENEIEEGYALDQFPSEYDTGPYLKLEGLKSMNDIHNKIIYSLESFIMIMKNYI